MAKGALRILSAPIIVTAQLAKADQSWANTVRRRYFPPERNHVDAHITLFHHLPPLHLPEIKTQLSGLAGLYRPPIARIDDVMLLARGVAYHVQSDALMHARMVLANAFTGLLIPQDQAKPRLHITIQNKVDAKVARTLHQSLTKEFTPRGIGITGLSAFYYRGGPWDHIQSWSFRGKAVSGA